MISVLIPVRNMASLLDRALTSVWHQTYDGQIEVIVADDASTDHIDEVLGLYSPSITLVRNPSLTPWGICGGRNAAFAESTGEFILPLDADDWIAPTYIEKTLAKMTEGVGIVSTEMVYHGLKEGVITPIKEQTYESELRANNITVTSLVRMDALQQAGSWDYNLRGWEDWDMWLRILKLGWKHAVVNEPLFHYRLHEGGMNAWANQPENKQRLYGYLYAKHPGFGDIRKTGLTYNGI